MSTCECELSVVSGLDTKHFLKFDKAIVYGCYVSAIRQNHKALGQIVINITTTAIIVEGFIHSI